MSSRLSLNTNMNSCHSNTRHHWKRLVLIFPSHLHCHFFRVVYTMLPQPTPSHVPKFRSKREIIVLKRQQGIINAVVSLGIQRARMGIFILVQATPGEDRMSVCTGMFHHAFHLCLKFPVHSPTAQHLPVLSICNNTVTNV